MKKILMVSLGRINSYSFETAKIVANYSSENSVIVSEFAIERGEEWDKLGFKNVISVKTYKSIKNVIPATIRFLFKDLPQIVKLAKKENFDILYAPQSFYFWLLPIVLACRIPRFITTIHDPDPHSGAFGMASIVDAVTPRFADDIVILSETFRGKINRKYKLSNSHIHTIPCGLYDIYDAYVPLQELNYEKEKINFLFFGRIEKYKGLDILLEAYSVVKQKYAVSLTIVGRGDLSGYSKKISQLKDITVINRYIRDNEVRSCFMGPNLILVIPYLDATQSGPLVIAQKYGVPIIATNTGALPEQLQYGRAGFLCEAGSVNSLADTMIYVINHPDEVEDTILKTKVRTDALQWDKLAEKFHDLFND